MPSYTRAQLYNGTIASADITLGHVTFQMVNNAVSTAYFNIESLTATKIFSDDYNIFGELHSFTNCTAVKEDIHVSFIVAPHSTGSFTTRVNTIIPKEEIKFSAANAHIFSINDPDASGSFFGVDLSY